jgi:hypothetical protein
MCPSLTLNVLLAFVAGLAIGYGPKGSAWFKGYRAGRKDSK